jgi:hypothetical protein
MQGVSAKRIVPGMAAVLCTLVLLGASVHAQSITAETVARIDPAEEIVSVGQEITVDVYIADVSGLYGADIILSFNPLLLAVTDANPGLPGVQAALGPLLTHSQYFAIRNEADNSVGTVWVALTQLNPAPPVTGSGVFMRVTFHALAEGASALHFASTVLADRNGTEITASTQDGAITVTPASSLPFSVWLPNIGNAFR